MSRTAGLLISGLIEQALLVGPMDPATNLGLVGSIAVNSSAISRAILHHAFVISLEYSAMW